MDEFAPYHKFAAANRLDRLVTRLYDDGALTADVFQGYQRYHYALVHKLRSAKYHLDRLQGKLTDDWQEASVDPQTFMFTVNLSVDGFFYAAGSALDILAREVITYFGQPLPDRIYFNTARTVISRSHPNDPILARLRDPTWYASFKEYRNSLTHELILANDYSINIRTDGMNTTRTIVFPLPDDPRVSPDERAFRNSPDALVYLKRHFSRVLSVVNQVYTDIVTRGDSVGRLPL